MNNNDALKQLESFFAAIDTVAPIFPPDMLRSANQAMEVLKAVPALTRPCAPPVSDITLSLIEQLRQRDGVGMTKYGVSLDRKDLTLPQWMQHATEEFLDAAGYMQCAIREYNELYDVLSPMGNLILDEPDGGAPSLRTMVERTVALALKGQKFRENVYRVLGDK